MRTICHLESTPPRDLLQLGRTPFRPPLPVEWTGRRAKQALACDRAVNRPRRLIRRDEHVVGEFLAERLERAEGQVVQVGRVDRDARDVLRRLEYEAADVVDRRLQRDRVDTALGRPEIAVEQLPVHSGTDGAIIDRVGVLGIVSPLGGHLGRHATLLRVRQQRVFVVQVVREARLRRLQHREARHAGHDDRLENLVARQADAGGVLLRRNLGEAVLVQLVAVRDALPDRLVHVNLDCREHRVFVQQVAADVERIALGRRRRRPLGDNVHGVLLRVGGDEASIVLRGEDVGVDRREEPGRHRVLLHRVRRRVASHAQHAHTRLAVMVVGQVEVLVAQLCEPVGLRLAQ
mmetsp:Transcript_32302/g.80024  ORF Transcript_32302/g.80024 Transcript_32302/m.80024 type:complete len:348 (+) Transcript_32302:850-1893(+)